MHVPSPDWREQVVYFLMIDRFDDGEPGNNDQGVGEYDPHDGRRYSGGDLAGIRRRLDYIQGLGATAIWVTPPVAHQWWDGRVGYGGYHGYWGEHFKEIDAHFGTLEDYQALARDLHARGMYLIQDVVLNHVGNYFGYEGGWDENDPAAHFRLNPDARPSPAPRQSPFHLNDARNPEHRAAAIYHWTPVIADFTDRRQELEFQLADLDDLNTGNPVVRQALRRSYGHWIQAAGVDGFRVDTAFHVPADLFDDFLHADDADAPGVLAVARATGRDDFFVFGEGFGVDRAHEEVLAQKIESYKTSADGTPLLPGMLNFPLYGSAVEVFADGRATAVLGYRIASMMRMHARPWLMPSFVDNHDVDRFLAIGDEVGLKQSLLLLMTLPGIPVLYYGTEQGFVQRRQAMFDGGYQAAPGGHFDETAPLYGYIAEITRLRRQHPLFAQGTPVVLRDQDSGPGVLAYRVDGEDGEQAVVVFNSAGHRVLADALETGLAPGTRLRPLYGIDQQPDLLSIGRNGRIDLVLPPRSAQIWLVDGRGPVPARPRTRVRVDAPERVDGDFELRGRARAADRLLIVVDGDLERAVAATPDARGRWRVDVDTSAMSDAQVAHRVVAWAPQAGVASAAHRFRVERPWRRVAELEDPAGDDHGPLGRYRYPTDPGWGEHRQLDLLGATVDRADGALRLGVQMNSITSSWNPPNGFDRVAFTIYLSLPGRDDGARVLPQQNAHMPEVLRWHYRLRAGGWSQVLTRSEGATADHEGTAVIPGADVQVDRETNRIVFTIPAAALDRPASLNGASVYITTWDHDGGYRGLDPEPGSHRFGGGDGRHDPLIMDDLLIRLHD